jgi:hypothetical protein
MVHDAPMGAPACDIPAWMVRALEGEGVIEVRQPRAATTAAVTLFAGAAFAARHLSLGADEWRPTVAAWLVALVLLVGAGVRVLTIVLLREPAWAVDAEGVTTPGWRPRRRWRVGEPSEASWRWDEEAWRFRPMTRSPELHVRERQLRFVPVPRPAHAA